VGCKPFETKPQRFGFVQRHTYLQRSLLAWLFAASLGGADIDAEKLYKEARKAEKAGQIARAYLLYANAAALSPQDQDVWLKAQALQSRAAMEAKVKPPEVALREDAVLPVERLDAVTVEDLAEARKPLPPVELEPSGGRRDFHLAGDARQLFEQIARAFGLDTVFDGDYPAAPSAIRFRMEQADHREALHALEAATGSFIVPLSEKLFLVVQDTPQKRNEAEPSVALTVDVPEPATSQDLIAMITAVQQTLAIEKAAWDTQKNVVVIRDKISKAWPARQLFEQLLRPRAEIELQLEFLEVNSVDVVSYGLSLPSSFPIVYLGRILNNTPTIPQGITGLALFGGGRTLFGIGITDASLVARMSKTNARTLLRAQIRSIDGMAASFHVGDRFPVLTSGYFGVVDPDEQGQVYTPPPSFQFEDLGLSLKVTPKVHGRDQLSLDVESEFKVLGGAGINGIPIISNRKLDSQVRLDMDQWAIIGGLMTATEARTISGIVGLARVPVIGPLLRSNTKTDEERSILILIKPRLLMLPPSERPTQALRVGSETRPLTPL
jgi:type II secretory pathway component GspD/PulD (secretin)